MSPRDEGLHLFASPLTSLEAPIHGVKKQQITPGIGNSAENALRSSTSSETEHENALGPHASSSASTKRGFHKHHEARPVELFYDLFFVGNLTSFTYIHPVNDGDSLSSYVGFFSVLWFTWLQVTLYDVRFGNDSIMERIFKGIHLGGMVGFSVLGPSFLPEYFAKNYSIPLAYSLILMGTRLCLTLQYLSIEWLAISEKESRRPLLFLAGNHLAAAIIYAIMAGALSQHSSPNAYIAWYIIAILETVVNIIVSSRWKIVSFRGTHLVERMSLLTLIIVGEGIIVLMKSIQYVVQNPDDNRATTAGIIIAVVITYYFLYMLYFDTLKRAYFGLVREQIWAFFHFPFHVALVLVVEGINEMFLFRKIWEQIHKWDTRLRVIYDDVNLQSNATLQIRLLAQSLTTWAGDILEAFPEAVIKAKDYNSVSSSLASLKTFNGTTEAEINQALDELANAASFGDAIIFYSYGTKESSSDAALDLALRTTELVEVFQLVFGYVFIAAGCVLLILAAMMYTNRSFLMKLPASDWVSIGTHVFFGVGLALISIMLVGRSPSSVADDPILFKFGQSPWVIPLIVFCFGITLLVDTTIAARRLKSEEKSVKSKEESV